MMDDDAAPRRAPPPRPSVLPNYNAPRPVVPEVSLMFDSEDSLIWQQPKSNLPASLQQKRDAPFTKVGSTVANQRVPVIPAVNNPGKQAAPSRVIQGSQSTTHFKNRADENYVRPKLPLQSKTEGQFQRESSGSPVLKNPMMSDKHYNPLIYSPSQKNGVNKEVGHSSSPPVREISPLITRNTVPVTRVLTPQTQNTVSSSSHEDSVMLSKNSWPSQVTTKSVHFYKNPVMSDEETPLYTKRMEQHQRCLQTYGYEKENVKPYSPAISEGKTTEPSNFAQSYRKDLNTPPSVQYNSTLISQGSQSSHRPLSEVTHQSDRISGQSSNHCNPNVYHLIEKQNEHIFRLQSSLEKLLEKQEHNEAQRNKESRELLREIVMATSAKQQVNQKQIFKDTCSQTELDRCETKSIGINTEISWADLIASVMPSENAVERGPEQDAKFESREAVKFLQTSNKKSGERQADNIRDNYQPNLLKRRDSSSRQATNWTVHKEMSLTMQEVVMKTIEEDPPSPDPSVHISMTEYHDGSRHEEADCGMRNQKKKSVEWEGSPVLGESASICSPAAHDSPQHQESAPAKATGVTFYNNVMTNIQHILQNSKAAEEEERSENAASHQRQRESNSATDQQETTVIDPQTEAVRKQLMQFGISFIDPATLASNNRPVLDTMYLPGLHNMLSMYQHSMPTSETVPYQETDATAAKYLSDAQLAAIAAASPAMTGRTRAVRETKALRPPFQQIKNPDTENNFSMATKKFLGKYGLQEDYT